MTRQRINIDVGPMYHNWLNKKAKQLGITRTELCRQLVIHGVVYGVDYDIIKESVMEHRELVNQSRSQSQIIRHRSQRRSN